MKYKNRLTCVNLTLSTAQILRNGQKRSSINVSRLAFSLLSSDWVLTVLKLWCTAVTWGYTAGCHDTPYMVLTLVFFTTWSERHRCEHIRPLEGSAWQQGTWTESTQNGCTSVRFIMRCVAASHFPSIFIFLLLWSVQVFDEIVLGTLAVLLLQLSFQKTVCQFYCSCVCGDIKLTPLNIDLLALLTLDMLAF